VRETEAAIGHVKAWEGDMKVSRLVGLIVLFVALAPVIRAQAYEYPLTSEAIREAYFLGAGSQGKQGEFYDSYAYSFHMPNTDLPGSLITVETPFLQVVERASRAPNYDAQDAVKEFLDKPGVFRVYADIYYRPRHPVPADANADQASVNLTVKQNGKKIIPDSTDRWGLTVFHDAGTGAVSIGEHVQLEFKAGAIVASPLTVAVSTSDDQTAETTFDLSSIR
jgi:hypothetical protein